MTEDIAEIAGKLTKPAPCKCCKSRPWVKRIEHDEWGVGCTKCSNEGPLQFGRTQAVRAWNAAQEYLKGQSQ